MRSVLAAILVFEAIICGLAIPVASGVAGVATGLAAGVGGGVAVSCLATCALVRTPVGLVFGSVLQLVAFGLGLAVPMMFALGGLFGVLWFSVLVADRRIARSQPQVP